MSTLGIIIFIIVAVPVLFFVSLALGSSVLKGPSNKTIIGFVEKTLKTTLGNKYSIVGKRFHAAHSDGILDCTIRIPEEQFERVIEKLKTRKHSVNGSQIVLTHNEYDAGNPIRHDEVLLDLETKLIHLHSE